MHYNKQHRGIRVKSSTFYVDLFIFYEICEYAKFYAQSPSRIIEQALIFTGGDFEKALQKSQRFYKKNRIQRKKGKFKSTEKTSKGRAYIAESLFKFEAKSVFGANKGT